MEEKRKVKVLFLGSGNINPINILCQNLKEHGSVDYHFSGLNLYKKGVGGVKTEYKFLDDCLEVGLRPNKQIPKSLRINFLLKKRNIKKVLKTIIVNRFKLRKSKNAIFSLIQKSDYLQRVLSIISDFDIINAHYLSNWQSQIIPLIPKNKRVIISIWGSDLMATAGKEIYALQLDAIYRADAITYTGQEIEQILLSKFGRNLKPKFFNTLFGLPKNDFESLVLKKETYLQIGKNLLKKNKINACDFPYIIKLGYSAYESQNHKQVLREMAGLNSVILEKVLFVIPMTYGNVREGYKEEIENFLLENGLNGIVLKNYLTKEEAISLSFVTNIMFNLRENDAFNNSMMESLIAGGIVFNGSWLPYNLLRNKQVHFIEVPDIKGLREIFSGVISNFDMHYEKAQVNATKLQNFVSGENVVNSWEKAFNISN